VTVRDLRSGTTKEMTFNSGDRVENVRLETREVEYLYEDAGFLYFMDVETYEQPQVQKGTFSDDMPYLTPSLQIKLSYFGDEIIDYDLPVTVEQEVTDSEMAVAGDTATGATKLVTTETGLKVTVPLFVDVGDRIRVDTRTGEYLTRV
jgi:elongation factor P